MELYPPFTYFKWGVIISLVAFVPNLHVLGIALMGLGLGLELIDRIFREKSENTATEDQGS